MLWTLLLEYGGALGVATGAYLLLVAWERRRAVRRRQEARRRAIQNSIDTYLDSSMELLQAKLERSVWDWPVHTEVIDRVRT